MGIDTEQKGRIMAGSTARGTKSKSQTDKSQMEERGGGYDLPVNPSGTAFYRAFLRGNPSGAVSNPSGSAKEVFSFQYLSGKPEERQAYREKTS
jgi:hypothetical protein